MTTRSFFLARALLVSALAYSFAQAAEQDDPPIGKGRFILYEDFEGTNPGSAPTAAASRSASRRRPPAPAASRFRTRTS
jgi:hypothetical protein